MIVGWQRDEFATIAHQGVAVIGVLRQCEIDIGAAEVDRGESIGEIRGGWADDGVGESSDHGRGARVKGSCSGVWRFGRTHGMIGGSKSLS